MATAVASSSPATVNGSISTGYLKDPASPVWANDATVKQYNELMAKYNPRGKVTDGLNFYGFAKADTFVRAMYKAGPNPTRAGLMKALLSFNETSAIPVAGLSDEVVADRPFHHLAHSADAFQRRRLDAVRPADRRTAARLAHTRT